jgi:hypothetical protein
MYIYSNGHCKKLFKINRLMGFLIPVLLSGLILSGCGFVDNLTGDRSTGGRPSSDARNVSVKKNFGIDDLRDVATSDGRQSVNASGIQTGSGGFLNANTENLFDERLRDEDERFNRLENAVQAIHNEFMDMKPAITRLISIEGDIKELHKQLSLLVNDGSLDEASANANSPLPMARSGRELNVELPVAERPNPRPKVENTAKTEKITALQIKAGDHANKTRIVFSTPQKQNYTVNFDAENQLLTVESNANITKAAISSIIKNSKRIADADIDAESSTGDSVAAILTRDISRISNGSYIGPTPQKNYHRFYVDLFTQ